ncbi:MAG TPA: metallophosphoesterase [Phycisphaerae bacterium]|nr:metallophosphoesterase [Phycisphaerae bacterium]
MSHLNFAIMSCSLDLGFAAILLFGIPRRRTPAKPAALIGAWRIIFVILATAAFFALKMFPLQALGVGIFGLVYCAYVDLVIVAPLFGLNILVASSKRSWFARSWRFTGAAKVMAAVALLGAPVGAYATFIEPFRLQTERASCKVDQKRAGRSPIRVGVLTDLQTGRITDYERGAVDRLMAEKPDLILIPGDIFQTQGWTFDEVWDDFHALFARLHAPAGVFCVQGDVDSPSTLRRLFEGTDVRFLFNEHVQITHFDRRITVGGSQLHWAVTGVEKLVADMEALSGEDDIRILVSHRPDVVRVLGPHSRIDLVVAGHTHGGQVVIPFFGPPITLTTVPRKVAAGGLHEFEGNSIYVSRGVGVERTQAPRIRFFCPPEISIITIE